MTYLQFHLVFILPPILLLGWLTFRRQIAGLTHRRVRASIPLVALIAFVYTTPWDNYLVYREIWGYPEGRVLATIYYVPVEEYMFFLLQPVLTGFAFILLLLLYPLRDGIDEALRPSMKAVGGLFWLAITALGFWLLTFERGTYMGLILAWASPVLAGMWAWKGDVFWRFRRHLVLGVMLPTVYLWIADRIAIGLDIWYIAEPTTLGFKPLGLPIEEATFFLITNILCVQGLMLFMNVWSALPRRQDAVA
ncbi:MAG: lycopene cyclase domain-containing protein [Bacteroidota bacterium]